ncbi:MAG: hypothetical protein ACFCGT_04880 [Sandaracinaceae bacterium]
MRTALSILAGFSAWTLLWCTSNYVAASLSPASFGADGSVWDPALLTTFLVLSLAFSLLGGYLTARLARERAWTAAGILAGIQLLVGTFVQASYWDLMPLWFHLPFLAMLVPGILAGARVGAAAPARAPTT